MMHMHDAYCTRVQLVLVTWYSTGSAQCQPGQGVHLIGAHFVPIYQMYAGRTSDR